MIQYQSMTAKEALDEVIIRLGKYRTGINLDWQTMLHFLSAARREVTSRTLSLKNWSYTKSIEVSNNFQLPTDFIRPIRCLLKSGASKHREARRIDIQEVWTLTNACYPHSFNPSTLIHPTYWFWGRENEGFNGSVIWNADAMFFHCHPRNMTGFLEYHAQYPDFSSDTERLQLQAEAEQLCILLVLESCYAKLGMKPQLQAITQQVNDGFRSLRPREVAKDQSEAVGLEAVENPEPVSIAPVHRGQR